MEEKTHLFVCTRCTEHTGLTPSRVSFIGAPFTQRLFMTLVTGYVTIRPWSGSLLTLPEDGRIIHPSSAFETRASKFFAFAPAMQLLVPDVRRGDSWV